jgi:hypothetical protein
MSDSESISIRQLYSLAGNSTYFLVITLIVLVAFVARAFTLFTASIDADEGGYLVMAKQWQHGGLPYIAVWDQHPPRLARRALAPDPSPSPERLPVTPFHTSVSAAGGASLLCVRGDISNGDNL